jgi:osmotically-inducible protein OsmY
VTAPHPDTDVNAVTLIGHVRTWAEQDAVIVATSMTPGVFDVFDELVVTG